MANFNDLTSQINSTATALEFFNTITFGQADEIDLNRQGIFPILHIVPTNASRDERTTSFTFEFHAYDLVDFNKDDIRDIQEPFNGTDNLQDVLNSMMLFLDILIDKFNRGTEFRDLFQVDLPVSCSPFFETQSNKLAGWSATISFRVPNSSTTDGRC